MFRKIKHEDNGHIALLKPGSVSHPHLCMQIAHLKAVAPQVTCLFTDLMLVFFGTLILFKKYFIYFERGEGREKERERNINV